MSRGDAVAGECSVGAPWALTPQEVLDGLLARAAGLTAAEAATRLERAGHNRLPALPSRQSLPAPFHELFGVAPIGVREWVLTSALAVVIFLLVEAIKALGRRREHETQRAGVRTASV